MTTYTGFLIDDFNDNSLDSSLWDAVGTGVTESSGKLNVTALHSTNVTIANGKKFVDVKEGIIAGKLTKSAGSHPQMWIDVGVIDTAGFVFRYLFQTSTATISRNNTGSTTGTTVVTDTTVGLGPTWTNGTWIGLYYLQSDNTIRCVKSTDGVTWSEIVRVVVTGGAFDWRNCAFFLEVDNQTSPASDSLLTASLDDYTYFADNTYLKSRCRVSGAWVMGLPKVRIGGVWVPVRSKARQSGAFVIPN